MNNNADTRPNIITRSQAQDEPTQPAETTTAFIRRILQHDSLPTTLLKGSCYLLGGYIVYKTINYATDTSIPLDDRERTVKMVGSFLGFIPKLLW